ncbi:MAG: hypothetical protein FWE19_09650 [Oscillospiraceae bacterium]|nr:hypothetical protein [Oscillospiraceae bacterium]
MFTRRTAAALLTLVITTNLSFQVLAAPPTTGGGGGPTIGGGSGAPTTGGGDGPTIEDDEDNNTFRFFFEYSNSRAGSETERRDIRGGSGDINSIVHAPAASADVFTAASAAIQLAHDTNTQADVVLTNVTTVPIAAIQSVFAQATRAGLSGAIVHLDTRERDRTLSRIFIDAETAANLSGDIDFRVWTNGIGIQRASHTFERSFSNNFAAVSFGHTGVFGTEIRVAVTVDLFGLNTGNLMLFAHDLDTNTYTQILTVPRVDSNGFLHFTTPVGGDIIITDAPLARR